MAIGGICFRGADFPVLCLVRRALGQRAMDHGRQQYHMMWRKDKRKDRDWHGTVYGSTGSSRGEKPSSPRSRASSPCDPPTGRTSQRVRPENLPTTPLVCGLPQREVVKAAVRTPSAGPREHERRPRGDRPWPRQLVIRPVGMAGGHNSQARTSPVLGTPRRSIWGSSTG